MTPQQSNFGEGDENLILHSTEESVDDSTTSDECYTSESDSEDTLSECNRSTELKVHKEAVLVDVPPECLKKMLRPYSKYCILDQSFYLENPNVVSFKYFLKFMIISKRFVIATQKNVLYRLFVVIKAGFVCFYLKRNDTLNTRMFKWSFEKAQSLVRLFQPLLIAEIGELETDQIMSFLKLLNLERNKIGFHFAPSYTLAQFLIEDYWLKISELKCSCSDLTFGLPFKSLNKLQIYGVHSSVDLWPVLRFEISELQLQIQSGFSAEDNGSLPFKSEIVKKCELTFLPSVGEGAILRAAEFMAKSYPRLKELSVNTKFFFTALTTTDGVVTSILRFYNNYKAIVQVCLESAINLKLKVQATYSNDRFKLLENWTNALFANADFQVVKHETTVTNFGNASTKFFGEDDHPNVRASFSIDMKYRYGNNAGDVFANPMQQLLMQ